jgi:anthranilate synthase component 2
MTIDEIKALNPEKIILSPGPSTPDEAGVTLDVIREFADTTPIFGICLGHQSIAQAFGGEVIRAKHMMHGKTSQVEVDADTPIFKDLPTEFRATR